MISLPNTYTHHAQTVRGAVRAERNMLRAVTGGIDELDHATRHILATVHDEPTGANAA